MTAFAPGRREFIKLMARGAAVRQRLRDSAMAVFAPEFASLSEARLSGWMLASSRCSFSVLNAMRITCRNASLI